MWDTDCFQTLFTFYNRTRLDMHTSGSCLVWGALFSKASIVCHAKHHWSYQLSKSAYCYCKQIKENDPDTSCSAAWCPSGTKKRKSAICFSVRTNLWVQPPCILLLQSSALTAIRKLDHLPYLGKLSGSEDWASIIAREVVCDLA